MVRVLPLMFALALAAAQAPTTSKPSADVGTAQPSLDEPIRAQFVGGARLAPDQSIPRAELEAFVLEARAREPGLAGYVWQGRQYEGLNCNFFEALWGHGGRALGPMVAKAA